MRRGFLFFFIFFLMAHLSWSNEVSPTFLPMVRGEWLIIGEHSVNGKYSHQACMSDEELAKYYLVDDILQFAQENQKDCRLTNNSRKADRLRYDLSCREGGLKMKAKYQFTKDNYSQYVLERSVSTVPNALLMNYNELVIFKRIGPCR